MLGDAITFPKAQDRWEKTVVTGGLLLVVGVLVVPILLLLGYFVRVVRSGIADDATPPVFESWGKLLVDGLKLLTILLVYAIAFVILFSLAFSGVIVRASETIRALGTVGPMSQSQLSLVDLGTVLFVWLLVVVAGYLSLAATARFAHKDRFRAAFEIRAVVRTAFTSEFFVGFVLFLTVWIVLGVVSVALLWAVVGLFLIVYTCVAACYLIGRGYGKAIARRTHTGLTASD